MVRTVKDKVNYYNLAIVLAVVTVFYNFLEGLVSVFFGVEDNAVSLLGFGVDSFAEVISGIGIWHMSVNLKRVSMTGTGVMENDEFETRALRITGFAYYLLFAGLIVSSAITLYRGHKPVTTFWGILISLVSIVSMWILIHYKVKIGKGIDSQAIIADANCSRACLSLSVVLLIASLGYELTGYGGIDSIGGFAISYISLKEGIECFRKAKGDVACTCSGRCEKEVT
ncbi:MAG: cation transporter [Nitrospirae bacterium]|nr:cation transporter [Nitrospirota bacterium]MBF0553288.1 cation transporter [Nitrospirota bacterium]